jgi:hypothetical protein
MASRQREFNLQVRFTTDDASHYEVIEESMKQQCQAIHALFIMLSGQGIKPPEINLTSEDFIEGSKEIEWREAQS